MASGGVRLGSIASRPGTSSAFASAPNGKTVKSEIYVDPSHSGDNKSNKSSVNVNTKEGQLPHVASASLAPGLTTEGKWCTLAPLQERQKENRPVPQKWSETTVCYAPHPFTVARVLPGWR
jgi:hypothetical protein